MSATDDRRPAVRASGAPPARSGPDSSATAALERALNRVSRVRGVRGSMWVSADDGIAVAQLLMEGIRGKAIAAFAASLARKVGGAAAATGAGKVRFVQLAGEGGTLLVAPAAGDLLIVVLAEGGVNIGLARLEMMRAAEAAPV